MSNSACRTPQIPFYRRFFKDIKRPGTNFRVKFQQSMRYAMDSSDQDTWHKNTNIT